MFSRIFLSMFFDYDYRQLELFSRHYLELEEAIMLIKIFLVFLGSMNIAWGINITFIKEKGSKDRFDVDILKHIVFIALMLFYGLFLAKILLVITLIGRFGYLYIFTGGLENYDFPIVFYGVENFTRFFFVLYLYNNRKNLRLIHILPYLAVLVVSMLIGQRGPALVSMVLLMWIYSVSKGGVKIRYVIMMVIFGVFSSQFIAAFRYSSDFNVSTRIFTQFLYSQGISMNIIGYLVKFPQELIHDGSFYFQHYFNILFTPDQGGQTLERLSNIYLGDHLTYFLSPDIYLAGRGTGTTIIGEFYDLASSNLYILAVITILFGSLSFYIAKRLFRSVFFMFIGYNYLYRFIYSPRDSVGKALNFIKNDYFLLIPLIIFVFIVESSRNKEKSEA